MNEVIGLLKELLAEVKAIHALLESKQVAETNKTNTELFQFLSVEVARTYRVVPTSWDEETHTLGVAMDENISGIQRGAHMDDLQFLTNYRIKLEKTLPFHQMNELLHTAYGIHRTDM